KPEGQVAGLRAAETPSGPNDEPRGGHAKVLAVGVGEVGLALPLDRLDRLLGELVGEGNAYFLRQVERHEPRCRRETVGAAGGDLRDEVKVVVAPPPVEIGVLLELVCLPLGC